MAILSTIISAAWRYEKHTRELRVRQVSAIYIFNFQVDNQTGADVSPGFGFDYMRMVVGNYGNPPVDNTLPSTFKNGKTTTGRVVFTAPAGLHNFSVRFLYQLVAGQQDYPMSI